MESFIAVSSAAFVAALLCSNPVVAQCPADYTCKSGLQGYDETVSMNVQLVYGINLPAYGVYGGSGYDCDGEGGFVQPVFCCVKGSGQVGA